MTPYFLYSKKVMKTLTLWCLLIYSASFGQAKFEIQEFTGNVTAIRPGWGFALEIIELTIGEEVRNFKVDPIYGKDVLSKIQIGKPLTLRASVNLTMREKYQKANKISTDWGFRFTEQVTEILIQNNWVKTPIVKKEAPSDSDFKIILEEKIIGDYNLDGIRKGLLFNNGLIAYAPFVFANTMAKTSIGNKISFMGSQSTVRDGYIFPLEGIKNVVSFAELTRAEGKIQSYIYKQNYVRIGLVINGKRFSFSSEYAKQIERFNLEEKVLIYYYGEEEVKANLLPTIHAIIQHSDTLYIPGHYFGGPDGRHTYKEVDAEGSVKKINRTVQGRMYSLILENNFYVEVNAQIANQLESQIKKGVYLKIQGDERIKKEGEIYQKNYRIVIPKKMTINEKEFILTN
jgi:hypothetical protein